jgi:hypothetical protein
MPMAAGSHIPDVSPNGGGGDRGLDYVVIFGNDPAATSGARGAHPDRKVVFLRVNGLRSYETAQDSLQNVADAMSGGDIGLGAFADPSVDIETDNSLVFLRFVADQQSRWEAGLASPSVGPDRKPHTFIEGRTIGLAFGDTPASVRDVALGPASSDHLLLSHITHALTALHCEEALITGSLIGKSGSRWSDAMDGFDPGLDRWRAFFEGPVAACRCETTTCSPGAGCLGQR